MSDFFFLPLTCIIFVVIYGFTKCKHVIWN